MKISASVGSVDDVAIYASVNHYPRQQWRFFYFFIGFKVNDVIGAATLSGFACALSTLRRTTCGSSLVVQC